MRKQTLNQHLLLVLLLAAPATLITVLMPQKAFAVELVGQMRGQVTDSSGLPVPGAELTVSSASMQGTLTSQSNAEGHYRFIALPPGTYNLTVTRSGFTTVTRTARVSVGGVVRLNVTMSLESEATMVVTDDAPTVDVTSTRSGTNLTKDMLRDIPNAGRSYQSATRLAAGVVGGGNPNMRGGLDYGNQYYIDGVNTTDPLTNTFSTNMNFDAIEEIEVITGGMDAEYGQSLGGAVNIITRSGGNSFHGDIQMLYNGTNTQVYTPLPDEDADEKPINSDMMAAINLGGPIIKDRLWFFTNLQMDQNTSTRSAIGVVRPDQDGDGQPDPMHSEVWRSAYLFGKLTWSPNSSHRVWLQAQSDPTNIDNSSRSIYVLEDAEEWWQQGGWLTSLGHVWTPRTDTIVETQLYAQNSYIRARPMQWKDCDDYDEYGWCNTEYSSDDGGQWYANDPDGFDHGPIQSAYYTSRSRYSLNTKATRLFSFFGEHSFKTGFQAEQLTSYTIQPGLERGIEYWSYTTTPDDLDSYVPDQLYIWDTNDEAKFTGQLISTFIQDVWNPTPRLTVRPGLRWDYGLFQDNQGTNVYDNSTLSPRIGAAFDLTNDGKTSLHMYYGRFYDTGFLAISSLMAKDTGGYSAYSWDERTEDWSTTPTSTVASEFLLHDDVKTPYSDEFDIGIHRDVGGGWALGATMTYEETHNQWEDDEVNLIWNEEGTEVIGSRDGTGETYYRLRTPDETFSAYTSLEFQANKQFNERWGTLASYTWSHGYGMYRDDDYGLASYSFDIDPQIQFERGLMPYDVTHNLKAAGSYRHSDAMTINDNTALGYLFGWNFRMRSGYPYRPEYYTSQYGGWYTYNGPLDGSYQLPIVQQTDLKTGLTLARGQSTWDLTVECFNVFNNRGVLGVNTEYDTSDGEVRLNEDGEIFFGSPEYRQDPRYFQLGLRGEF